MAGLPLPFDEPPARRAPRHAAFVALVLALGLASHAAAEQTARIGVLAFRGPTQTLQRWSPTAAHLTAAIPGWRFELVPLDLDAMAAAVRAGSLDFVLTNPGNYVSLEATDGVSRLVTLRNLRDGWSLTQFGAVVFVRADRAGLRQLADLAGHTLAAVSADAFGGYQMAWRELADAGVDPDADLASVRFLGFPQDAIVYAVRDRQIDAGTVRSDVLERMASEGLIDIDDFRVLSPRRLAGFPFRLTTRLYPEWPLAKLRDTSDTLSQQVAVALLTEAADSPAASTGQHAGWTIPLDYTPVHALMRDLAIGPYARERSPSLGWLARRYWPSLALALAVLIGMAGVSAWVLRTNRRLAATDRALRQEVHERRAAQVELARHRDALEIRVRERTAMLEQVNEALQADIEARRAVEQTLRRSESALRQLHDVTTSPRDGHGARVRALLQLGRRHFDCDVAVLVGPAVTIAEPPAPALLSTAERINDALVTASVLADARGQGVPGAPRFGGAVLAVPVMAAGAREGGLVFLAASPRADAFTAVDEDIATLMAQWLGGAMELDRAQSEVRQRQDELAHVARLGAMGEMATGIAHEVNQPLTAILNYARGALRRLADGVGRSADVGIALGEIEREAERAAAVVRGMRAFLRKGRSRFTGLDVNDAVEEVSRLLRPDAARHGATLVHELAPALPVVTGDRVQIEQVVLNLVRNALESLDACRADVREVRIATRGLADAVSIVVTDNGGGYDLSRAADMFEPFHTTKPDGMGMGLSICRTIVRAHGGELVARRPAAGGAQFEFTLPCAPAARLGADAAP